MIERRETMSHVVGPQREQALLGLREEPGDYREVERCSDVGGDDEAEVQPTGWIP